MKQLHDTWQAAPKSQTDSNANWSHCIKLVHPIILEKNLSSTEKQDGFMYVLYACVIATTLQVLARKEILISESITFKIFPLPGMAAAFHLRVTGEFLGAVFMPHPIYSLYGSSGQDLKN